MTPCDRFSRQWREQLQGSIDERRERLGKTRAEEVTRCRRRCRDGLN
jgi:hypothetical protein